VNWIFALRALAAPEPAALLRHRFCTAEAIAVIHAVCSKSEAANSQGLCRHSPKSFEWQALAGAARALIGALDRLPLADHT